MAKLANSRRVDNGMPAQWAWEGNVQEEEDHGGHKHDNCRGFEEEIAQLS